MSHIYLPESMAHSYPLASVGWWAESSACSAWFFCWIITGHHAPLNVTSLSLLKFFMFNHVSVALFRSQSVQCPVFVLCSATADSFYL